MIPLHPVCAFMAGYRVNRTFKVCRCARARHEGLWGDGRVDSRNVILALGEREWSASLSGRLNSRRGPLTDCMGGGWLGLRAVLNVCKNKEIS
jgi:hypothetical protein